MSNDFFGRVSRRASKVRRSIASVIVTPMLERRSLRSLERLIDPENPVVVSLTSYGARLSTVHLTIESIGRGSKRPQRIILWTDPGVKVVDLPEGLHRAIARGLEVQSSSQNFGPHTKYYPYVSSLGHHSTPLVTADDDSIYPRRWLEGLQTWASKSPDVIACYRAHRVSLADETAISPYNSWRPVAERSPSMLNFATGVSGVHYPPAFLNQLRVDGVAFMSCAPRADDVWLHSRAVVHGWLVRQIVRSSRKYPEIAATQGSALHLANTGQSANDAQIRATYDGDLILTMFNAERQP